MSETPTNLQPMDEANRLLGDETALREKFNQDGYLFIRNLAPVAALTDLRDGITKILAKHRWIEDGGDRDRAIAIGMPYREGEDGYFPVYDDLMKLEAFHALAHEPKILDAMRAVLGPTAFPHPLGVGRLVFPDNPEVTTPPHQDFPNNQGSRKLTAAWMPLSDCPRKLGPLAVLKGSHHFGVLPVQPHLGPGNRAAILPPEADELSWVTADFRLGDALFFPSLTIHAALENKHPDYMRLSVDYRYQPEGEPLTENCLLPHFNRLTWDEIYRDWRSDRLKYYWKTKTYDVVDWDASYHHVEEKEPNETLKMVMRYGHKRKQRALARQGKS